MLCSVQKSPEEMRISLMSRFPKASAHTIAEAIKRHGGDEDACIAHLMAESYAEGDSKTEVRVNVPTHYMCTVQYVPAPCHVSLWRNMGYQDVSCATGAA